MRSLCGALGVFVVTAVSMAEGKAVKVEGHKVVLDVHTAAPVGFGAIREKTDGDAFFLDPSQTQPTWCVILRDGSGKEQRVSALSAKAARAEASQGRLAWQGIELDGAGRALDVSVSMKPMPGEPLIACRIEVTNRSTTPRLVAVDFPVLLLRPTPAPADQTTLVFPRAYGRSWRDPFHGPKGYLVALLSKITGCVHARPQ